ncbi:TPR and ankyrin repeat-containing protein 1-like [Amphiura filiformis]|uniref:TPR and ankyrin repeat-containing protein 1-like n=1 Tax=Amphiura filiformis TaxID=82378 RepID=UPI003B225ABF
MAWIAGLPPGLRVLEGLPAGLQHLPDSPMEFIAVVKREGNNVIKSDPGKAIELYSKCIKVNELLHVVPDRDCATIHSNRSQAHVKMGNYGAALLDANASVKIDPSYVKGYWRAAMVMEHMNRDEEALEAFINGLNKVRGSGTQEFNTRVDFVYEITVLSSTLIGKCKKAEDIFRSIEADTTVWTEVVTKLSSKKEYKGLHLALLGGSGCFEKDKGGMATGCSTSRIDIKNIARQLSLIQLKDWGVKLIHQLIIQGADFNQFSVADGDTPLHCALKLALINGWFDLFDYLLREKYTKPKSRNLFDRSGSSLYHMVAKSTDGHEQRALDLLQNYRVNPFMRDSQDHPPLHYAANEKIRMGIKDAIDIYDKPSRPSSVAQQPRAMQQKPQPHAQQQQQKPSLQPHAKQQQQKPQPHAQQQKQKPPLQPHAQQQQQKPPLQPHAQQQQQKPHPQTHAQQEQQKPPLQPHAQQQQQKPQPQTHAQQQQQKHPLQPHTQQQTTLPCSLYQKGLNYAEHKQHVPAITCFAKFISENHAKEDQLNYVEKCRKAFVNELAHLKGIPAELECHDSPDCWQEKVEHLAIEQKWNAVSMLIKKGSFAYGCNCSNVSISSFLKSRNKPVKLKKQKFVQALLEHKACPNGLPNEEESTLMVCIKNDNCDIDTLMLLLEHRACPSQLSINPGDTPLHAALRISFYHKTDKTDRKFKVLNFLLENFSDPSSAEYLNPSVGDIDENTLLHIAINEGTKNLSLEAVELLSKHNVDPYVPNKKGEIPLTMVKQNDPRYKFLKQVAARHHPKPVPKPTTEGSNIPAKQLGAAPAVKGGSAKQSQPIKPPTVTKKDQIQMKQEMSLLIASLPPFVIKRPHMEEVDIATKTKSVKHKDNCNNLAEQEQESKDKEENTEKAINDEDELEEEEEATAGVEDTSIFDNLTWEVRCTANVWKILRDRHVQPKLKQGIIRRIQQLGNGNWRLRWCKQLDGLPRQHDMKLYEAKLTKGGRILWELALAFSPRCNGEKRLEKDSESTNGTTSFAVAGGSIYSEIIHIWDIVFDHNKLSRAIEAIVNSYKRGKLCKMQKKLVGMDRREFPSGKTTKQHVPILYCETSNNQQLLDRSKNFFPPASSEENKYHIMKFYSFNSSLVNAILTDSSVKVDFPFCVTELEDAIINLQPTPPSSVLLLGRSGTGKTTCCLYRLWAAFERYWKYAWNLRGEPQIPRDVAYSDMLEREEDQGKNKKENSEAYTSGAAEAATYEESASSCTCDPDKIMDHLHQIFITKNRILCSEVQRNFRDMSHACEFARDHCAVVDKLLDKPVPMRFQDVHPAAFPLFLGSKQFLLMLDGSLPNPFFPRNEDGSLKRNIQGWGKDEGLMDCIPIMEDEDEEKHANKDEKTINEDGDATDGVIGGEQAQAEKAIPKYDPRREVTYEVFSNELWHKINKTRLQCHPTLVWIEIKSFIKGSVEALHTEKGFLAEQEYQDLGRKRAPNFTADRGKIYKVYLAYEHEKRQRKLFDEADVIFHIYHRMRDIQRPDWAVHQFYVDETQDFTQAELSLIIRCCHDPNALFLTGDTAQSIMRGVAFRFDDLKSLFYYASKSLKSLGKHSKAGVPKYVYQLTHNYRSHTGILNLASSVVDLMFHFFPDSFDRLHRDQGLFDGPSPVLLESCSFNDLALQLRGKNKTSEIEFGAHQVILVAKEEAKESLPAELKFGLVLTIFEAKGLEFDDVLLYNFFKDSLADKEWRVVTEYLDELIEEQKQHRLSSDKEAATGLHTIDINNMEAANRPRPLKFDPDQHKVLNSELKYLYTAITRARVNMWLFDEDEIKRAPMFEYFRCFSLNKVVQPVDKDGNSELDAMFAEKSSPEDWGKRGDDFYKLENWPVAAQCYKRAGLVKKELKAEAHHHAVKAERLRDQPSRMKEEFLAAALAFLQCGDFGSLSLGARCLFNAKEYLLSAQLFEKAGEMLRAAEIFENQVKKLPDDASRCYEQSGDYAKAIGLLAQHGLHTKAVDVVKRFHQKKKKKKKEHWNVKLPSTIKPPKATDTVENLYFQSASYHNKHGNMEEMKDALTHLKFEECINFLKNKGHCNIAVDILKDEGKFLEAAKILRSEGKWKEACNLLDRSDEPQFIAECHLGCARKQMQGTREGDDTRIVEEILTTTLGLFEKTKDLSRKAETRWMLGVLKKDDKIVKQAKREFEKAGNTVGEIHAADSLLSGLAPPKYSSMRVAFNLLKHLFHLISAVAKPKEPEEQRLAGMCDEFYGIEKAREESKVFFNKHEGARVQRLLTKVVPKQVNLETVRHKIIVNDLIPMAIRWVECLRKVSRDESNKLEQCPEDVVGLECPRLESCEHRHGPYPQGLLLKNINSVMSLLLLDDLINEARKLPNMKTYSQELSEVFDKQQQQRNCAHLYDLLFQQHCHPRQISENGEATKRVFNTIRQYQAVGKQMMWYVKSRHGALDSFSRRANTDVWLQVWNVHRLFDKNTKVMEGWVAKEEKYCNDTWKGTRSPLGMMPMQESTRPTGIPQPDEGKRMYMSYMRRYFESFDKLYSQRVDVIDAVSSFTRFLGYIATHPVVPLIPSIRNIVSLLELWLTIILAIISKVEGWAVIVPANYLAQLNFYDALCSHRFNSPGLYSAISQVKATHDTLLKTIFPKLEYMVDLVCAYGKFKGFNILGNAFRDEACIRSGEAERSLVFTVVILCNVGSAFTDKDGTCIRQLLHTIPTKNYPPRLAKALESVKSAKSFRDSLVTLQNLLQERENELCFQCEWKNYIQDTKGPGLIYSKLNPEKFIDIPYEILENVQSHLQQEEMGVEAKGTDPDDMDISPEVAEKVRESHQQLEANQLLEEQQLRDKAAIKIQEWARQVRKKQKLLRAAKVFAMKAYSEGKKLTIRISKEVAKSEADSALGTPEHWVNDVKLIGYFINERMCSICNVTLNGKGQTESYQYEPSPTDVELDETTGKPVSPVVESPVSPILPAPTYGAPSKEDHEKSGEHQDRMKHFNEYKQYLMQRVYPVFRDAVHYQSSFDSVKDEVNKQRIDLFHERLHTGGFKLHMVMEDIRNHYAWDQLTLLDGPVKEIHTAVEAARQIMAEFETAAQESQDGSGTSQSLPH